MLNEHIHQELADIYDEFDRHSRITKTDYSIDADYPYLQGYTLLKCPDFDGFIRHIHNYVRNKPVQFRVNGSPVEYDQIPKLPRRRNNIVTFAVTPIQERRSDPPPLGLDDSLSDPKSYDSRDDDDEIVLPADDDDWGNYWDAEESESAPLSPEERSELRRAQERDALATAASDRLLAQNYRAGDDTKRLKAFVDQAFDKEAHDEIKATEVAWGMRDPDEEKPKPMGENQYKFADTKHARDQNPRINSKNKHVRSAFEESKFVDRLRDTLSEQVTFTEPDVLFTQSTHAISPEEAEADELQELEGLKVECNTQIAKYLGIIESSKNELTIGIAENMVEDLTKQVNTIDEMINARTS